ncbi:PREDICTED: T-cell receptor gamma-2 chain C region [Capra hircus]|uniref:T-cell receptor gamma-2 chain C region n=1 Tax=Capra hircus TaxID=9925 RepID=UPI00084726B3|nr:PREDICTED: T-cell receptor gamma-2 chain C region [Capra hircus]
MRAPALLLVVLAPVMQVSSNLMLITSKTGETASFPCDLTQGATYIHLYKHEEGMAPRRLLYYDSYNSKPVLESGISGAKYHVYKGTGRSYTFAILNLQASDSGIYYCAIWDRNNYIKNFNVGAKLIVTERNLAADTSPKPTVFLPSIAEINHDNAGTYLCLLENFFPDVITVSWRVKNDKRALPSQQGNTMKTKDTYMKLSWLTVTENSMDKQHVCVVKHQKNIGGIDQEIIFPSIKEVVSSAVTTTEPPTTEPPTTEPPNDCLTDESKVTGTGSKKACLKDESEVTGDTNSTKARLEGENSALQLQLTTTSAYYTYLLLLLRSAVYFVVIISCVFRRTGVCCDGKI